MPVNIPASALTGTGTSPRKLYDEDDMSEESADLAYRK